MTGQPGRTTEIVQRTAAQFPWRSNVTVLDKVGDA